MAAEQDEVRAGRAIVSTIEKSFRYCKSTPMKLDLLYEFQPKPGRGRSRIPYGQRHAEQQTYDEAIAEIQFADTLGFHTAWAVEHHFRDGRSACPTSEAVLGGLALSTTNIRLGFGVVLMPFGFIHPARVAEKVATVDILSHGRVEWGTGRSTPMEQIAFGVPTDDRSRDEWQEAVEIVVRMWEEERFSYDSPNFSFPERIRRRSRTRTRTRRAGWRRRPTPAPPTPAATGSGCCRSRSCSPSRRPRSTSRVYRDAAAASACSRSHRCATTVSARTRSCTARTTWTKPEPTALGRR